MEKTKLGYRVLLEPATTMPRKRAASLGIWQDVLLQRLPDPDEIATGALDVWDAMRQVHEAALTWLREEIGAPVQDLKQFTIQLVDDMRGADRKAQQRLHASVDLVDRAVTVFDVTPR